MQQTLAALAALPFTPAAVVPQMCLVPASPPVPRNHQKYHITEDFRQSQNSSNTVLTAWKKKGTAERLVKFSKC